MTGDPPGLRIRAATEHDHHRLVSVIDEWWSGRRMQAALPRLWLQHFAGTSLVAEAAERREPIGFVVGFLSQDRPVEAYLHLVGVSPAHRRRGVGRAMLEHWSDVTRARGGQVATTIAWPGDPVALAFLREVGWEIEEGPGTRPLYGTPAHTDWNREGDDQAVLRRRL